MKGRCRDLIEGRSKKFYWINWKEPREKVTVTVMLRTGRLPATRAKPYRWSRIASPLKMGPTGYPETSLTKHEPKLRNVPGGRRPEQNGGGRLVSLIFLTDNLVFDIV